MSRKKLRKSVIEERTEAGEPLDEEIMSKVTEHRLKEEIKNGIQTIQYQLITLMTCNGQAPFVTVFMYLDEVPEGKTRDDLAMIIEEVMKQRIQGVKNEKGVWITPAFPKLIYVLDEGINITEGSDLLVPDGTGGALYREADGAGLYFRKDDAGTEAGRRISLYRLTFLTVEIPREIQTEAINSTAVSIRAS